jgi:hypothetical protein
MKLTALEWAIVALCAFFALTSFLVDPCSAFGIAVDVNSKCPIIRASSQWAVQTDPLWLANPPMLRVQTGISVFVYGPLYVLTIIALFKKWTWIRLPDLLLSGALAANVLVYVIAAFVGYKVNQPVAFVAVNLPYLVLPILLVKRFG